MVISFITWIFSWIDFIVVLYIHFRSTIRAAIYIVKYEHPGVQIKTRRQRPQPTTKKLPEIRVRDFCQIKSKPKEFSLPKLPNEILIKVFNQLDKDSLFQSITVSKKWNQLAIPVLWKSTTPTRPIRLIPSFSNLDRKQLRLFYDDADTNFPVHLTCYGHAIVNLDLSLIASSMDDHTFRYIIHHCPKLTTLSLSNSRTITDESLRQLARSPVSRNLRTLILQNCRHITDKGLYSLAKSCRQLKTLHLGGCSRLTHEGVDHLMAHLGKNMQELYLNDCTRLTSRTIQSVAHHCGPELQVLDLAHLPFKHQDIAQLVMLCPNITHLNLSLKKPSTSRNTPFNPFQNNPLDDDHRLHRFAGLLDSLANHGIQPTLSPESTRHLESLIEQRRQRDLVSDRTIICVAKNLKKLRRLDLNRWSCLTDSSIRALTNNSNHLVVVGLLGCTNLSDAAIKYCRYLNVSSPSSSLSSFCSKK
ncbi:hypothetical protein G6F57_004367 [Rhizopus arrhizus]|uniref:F-box domain-containing protein n=1 Tax=Rhizopus oryzae TaxID=64495 RepID=A0A9P7BR87_RHIOR|nr:hypothetical protein G6F23_006582 [Rhizopus arrhizus]KAG1422800.1 hypothetical protein G6F58_003107 [Rhizopus delemar]KAG0762104.1 hypothetical protein G6F24_007047 [Rhizopus arrhizus]KAG0778641.1 hypothetical protein G6F22_011117 [Rhizopus arrhizus]KAG0791947.1 hypothetical protein G6F21_004707 [Rhizopus arrhizus]